MERSTELIWVLALLPVFLGIIYFFGLPALAAVCGFSCSFCAYMDYDWFMNHPKAYLVVKILGRKNARIFYALLGLVIVLGAGWVESTGGYAK